MSEESRVAHRPAVWNGRQAEQPKKTTKKAATKPAEPPSPEPEAQTSLDDAR